MQSAPASTRERLLMTAAQLFRQKGYHGVGLSEILAASGAPKGSLYHHFPNGKSDLALAAAKWASEGMVSIINASFDGADTFHDGLTTLCFKLAKAFDISGQQDGCPVTNALVNDSQLPEFRTAISDIFDRWIDVVAIHGVRFGMDRQNAITRAETLLIAIEGAWIIARTRQNSDILRSVPSRL